jgi:hypothetical protein
VPNDEMRSFVTDYGEITDPLLIPAQYVSEARRVGIRQSPDKHARHCRACQGQITTKEDFLAILIQRHEDGTPTKGFMHDYACTSEDQELPGSLSLPECWKAQNEFRESHPELFPEPESYPDDDSGYDNDDHSSLDDEGYTPSMVYVSTDNDKTCPYCDDDQEMDFEQACNHLISRHHLICVHVGSETKREIETGAVIQSTVAVFAKTPLGQGEITP